MTSDLVTRHAGARDRAEAEGLGVDVIVAHLDVEQIAPGDVIIDSPLVRLAAAVCARGARYLHLARASRTLCGKAARCPMSQRNAQLSSSSLILPCPRTGPAIPRPAA